MEMRWNYQINQQLHDFISDEVLGIIQENVPVVGFQSEAVQAQCRTETFVKNTSPIHVRDQTSGGNVTAYEENTLRGRW